jgi:hypothetical protein
MRKVLAGNSVTSVTRSMGWVAWTVMGLLVVLSYCGNHGCLGYQFHDFVFKRMLLGKPVFTTPTQHRQYQRINLNSAAASEALYTTIRPGSTSASVGTATNTLKTAGKQSVRQQHVYWVLL